MKVLIILSVILFASCTTMRNAERRHDRIVKNFPNVHKTDTVEIEKIVEIILPPKTIKGETIFEKCPDEGEEITKVDTLKNGTTIKTTLKGNPDGTKTINTDIYIPEQKKSVKTKINQPIIYVERSLKWHQKWWGMIFIILIFFVLGWITNTATRNFIKMLEK